MSELKSLILAKLAQPRLSALATVDADGKPWVRYVTPIMDANLTIRFVTHFNSRKVSQMLKNPEVHLTTGVTSPETAESYLQVQGRAEILTDEANKKAFWDDRMLNYFSGPDDPNYAIVEIKPYRIEYQAMSMTPPQVWMA
ncbi:MAG: pyridoxamine 5'-phosphate oxidase family protein [Deltaproteobacteria bacterium]|nr:pyridoxamine 5'-phosphate oxidase family protein [Deltaproteobacteria bacterium]